MGILLADRCQGGFKVGCEIGHCEAAKKRVG